MRLFSSGSNDTNAGAVRSRRLPPVALAAALSLAVAGCGGGGSAPPPPNPLFVSTATGSDSNSGTADKPLRSIERAMQITGNGYTIVVAPGTYAEAVTTDRTNAPAARDLVLLGDTSGQVFQSFGGPPRTGAVTIESPGVGIKLNSSTGTVIDGLTIPGAPGGGIVINKSNGVSVENCVVSGATGGNGDGIRVQSSANVVVFNNLVFDNSQRGIALVAASSDGVIINNTIVGNADRGISIGNSDTASPRAYVHNNIIQNNGSGNVGDNIKVYTSTIPSQDSLTGFDGDYNLVFPGGTYEPVSLPGRDDVNQDAMFVAGTPNEFLLQCDNPPTCTLGSPALDAGSDLPSSLQNLQACLFQWTTTAQQADQPPVDLGYHVPDADPLCALPALPPSPTPQR